MKKYTVDRFEGNLVVLLKKGDESVQLELPREHFPGNISEGDIVQEKKTEGQPRFQILQEETKDRRKQAEELLNKLKNKNK